MPEAKKRGRPPNGDLNNPKVVKAICDGLALGKSIAEICKAKDMPAESTVYLRMANDPDFRSTIAQAKEAQQDYEIDQIVEMADKATPEDWQVVKLRIWARQWRASKLAPKKYGDKLEANLNHSGGVRLTVSTGVPDDE
jgi:hypothetical protein